MRGKRFSIGLRAALAVFAVTLLVTSTWAATNWHEKVLFNFNGTDGYQPMYGLIFDAAGNLYGTAFGGGDPSCGDPNGCGTVFQLTPAPGGGWTETVLHSFKGYPTDGSYPYAGVIFDAAGNLYGTTDWGGTYGGGTVFELTPTAGGGWTEKVLHSFGNGADAAFPYACLIFDAAGNLYGTTGGGGTYGVGTVFELSPAAGGGWTETVLHSFNGSDGHGPEAGLIFDAAGKLYGTTAWGGTGTDCLNTGCGTVFKLTPVAGGGWTETVLHSFSNTDGALPFAGLIFDAAGNLYGTTQQGGSYGFGTVFELTPTAGGGWTETVLFSFNGNWSGRDGGLPEAGLIFDAAGNLYGTTGAGGTYAYGTAFELTPTAGGGWTETVLHSFNNNGTDGESPLAGLIFDAAGNLYGTTGGGGTYGLGMVFELTPIYPCVPKCSHTVSSGGVDVLPSGWRDVLEHGGIERP